MNNQPIRFRKSGEERPLQEVLADLRDLDPVTRIEMMNAIDHQSWCEELQNMWELTRVAAIPTEPPAANVW